MQKLGLGLVVLTVIVFLPVGVFCQSNPPANSGEGIEKSAPVAATTVAGIIRTAQGVPVPGATVRVVHLASGRSWVSWTDEDGKFSFPGLPAGRYRLEAKQFNFGASQLEVYFGGESATEAQLTLHVDVSPSTTVDTNSVAKTPAAPTATSTTVAEKTEAAKPAEESTSAARKNGHQPVGQSSAAAASSSKKSHHKGFQQAETKGQPTSAEGKTATPAENAANGSSGSKGNAQEQPLSAAGAAPDDTSSPLGDASSSDAFLMSGTVNRSATLGGSGSFGGVGGTAGSASSANFDSAASADEFPVPGQGGSSSGTGKSSKHRLTGKRHKKKQAQALAPAEANSFGQGIEQLWAQHRLSRLSSDRVHFSLVNRFDDSVWDARPYSLTDPNPPKIGHHSDKFGARVGGPLYIPHVYDGRQRTFFFVSYEFNRGTVPLDGFALVPTAAERNGDFTGQGVQLFDPTSSLTGPRTPLGSKIPQNRLDPAAVSLLQFIPLPNFVPNVPGFVDNYHVQAGLPTSSDLGNIKILHTISPKLNLSASYQANSVRAENPFGMPQLTSTTSTLGQAMTLDLTQNWTSRLINESKMNWSRYTSHTMNPFAFKRNVVGELGITGVSQAPLDWGVPFIDFSNFDPLIDTVPAIRRNQTLRVMDNVAYMLSKHTIRTGAEVRWIQLNSDTSPIPRGQYAFTGLMTSNLEPCSPGSQSVCPVAGTGFDFADFLMGFPQSTAVQFGSPSNNFREHEYIAYVQDDWRIHPRFAINLGVRYELLTPPVELYNRIADLVINPNITQVALICASPSSSPSCAPGRVNPFTGKALPRALMNTDTNNWSPRIGMAWRPSTKLPLVFRAGYGIFYNASIFNQLALSLTNQPPFAQANKLQTTTQTVLTLENGFPTPPPTAVTNTVAVDPNYQVGYVQVWDVSLESQLKPTLSIEVTYTGTKGTHLDLLRAPNRATPGSPFNTDISRRIPNAPGFTYDTSGASSIYHAAQLLVQRRMAHGLMVEGMYTFSRAIDNASSIGGGSTLAALLGAIAAGNARAATPVVVQDDNNFRAERGLSTFDMRQQFRGTYSYELPFGQTKRWLHNGWASAVFGNLQASGITVINTGMPFTALLSGNVADNSGTGAILSTRAAQIANANLPSGQRTPLHFFNTAAFTIPPPLQFGDASRGTITGPGTFWISFALQKKFRFGQDGRVHLDTRWEVQNLTNTPNFAGLHTAVDSALFGSVQAIKPMRTMDLMLRVSF